MSSFKTLLLPAVLLAGLTTLAACLPVGQGTTVSGSAEGAAFQPFACDDGTRVLARYRDEIVPDGAVELRIGGKDLLLRLVPSGSGSRFSTEQGLTPDMLLVWWEKDDIALMLESPLDDSAGPDEDVLRARCYLAASWRQEAHET